MNAEERKKIMREMGSIGGKKTMQKHGADHYKKLAEHMNEVRAQKKIAKELGETQAVMNTKPTHKGGKTEALVIPERKNKSMLFEL